MWVYLVTSLYAAIACDVFFQMRLLILHSCTSLKLPAFVSVVWNVVQHLIPNENIT